MSTSVMSAIRESMNPYLVLGLTPDASAEDIRKAYRLCSLKHHPDKVGNTPQATMNMQSINAAYAKLTNNHTRSTATDHFSEARSSHADGFESARPNHKPRQSYKTRNYGPDPEHADYFFGKYFKFPFDDIPSFNSKSRTADWEDFWANTRRAFPKPMKGRDKTNHHPTHQANGAFDRRESEPRPEWVRGPPVREAWEWNPRDRVDLKAKRAPLEEQYDLYQNFNLANSANVVRDRSGHYFVVPTRAAVYMKLEQLNRTLIKLLGGLCGIVRWLVDVADIGQESALFELARDAFNDAVRTAAKCSKLRNVGDEIRVHGWECCPEGTVCLEGELFALLSYLQPVESELQLVFASYLEMPRSKFARDYLFNADRRAVLWTALDKFRANVEQLARYRGARFMYPEYLGR